MSGLRRALFIAVLALPLALAGSKSAAGNCPAGARRRSEGSSTPAGTSRGLALMFSQFRSPTFEMTDATDQHVRAFKSVLMDNDYNELAIWQAMKVHEYDGFDVVDFSRPANYDKYSGRLTEGSGTAALQTLVRLFMLHGTVPVGDIVEILGDDVYHALVQLGLLQEEEELDTSAAKECNQVTSVTARLQITPVDDDLHVLTDFHSASGQKRRTGNSFEAVMYLGRDSRALYSAAPRSGNGAVLDLCCGSGVQAILAAKHYASKVVMVDLNPRAVRFSRFNWIFNYPDRKEDGVVLHGDLFNVVTDHFSTLGGREENRFDVILANPPYLAMPKGEGSMFGNGGTDGEVVTRSIMEGAPSWLKKDGRISMVANFMNPHLFGDKIATWFEKSGETGLVSTCRGILVHGDMWTAEHYAQLLDKKKQQIMLANLNAEKITQISNGLLLVFCDPERDTNQPLFQRTSPHPYTWEIVAGQSEFGKLVRDAIQEGELSIDSIEGRISNRDNIDTIAIDGVQGP